MCVCVGGGGGGGGGNLKIMYIFLVKGNQVMEQWGLKSEPLDTVSDVITISPPTF